MGFVGVLCHAVHAVQNRAAAAAAFLPPCTASCSPDSCQRRTLWWRSMHTC